MWPFLKGMDSMICLEGRPICADREGSERVGQRERARGPGAGGWESAEQRESAGGPCQWRGRATKLAKKKCEGEEKEQYARPRDYAHELMGIFANGSFFQPMIAPLVRTPYTSITAHTMEAASSGTAVGFIAYFHPMGLLLCELKIEEADVPHFRNNY
ncbi:hypothetical protein CRG98_003406 [Punica granatum]|uniref:Uncharacterized protein n=1 Tax=Punica granatum TaxID=22663 RepID=A0A2I0L635_PUNGR|nr:hypothetical protein CRG98_003406 [Punica granatum]